MSRRPMQAETGRAQRRWWATLWPFALAWPFGIVLYVAAGLAGFPLSRVLDEGLQLPLIVVFPFAAALAALAPEAPQYCERATLLGQFPLYALVARAVVRRGAPRAAGLVVVVLHLVGLVLASPLSWGPSLAAFERRLQQSAGPGAEHCGVVALHQNRSAAARCARAALVTGRPFAVAFQHRGTDSTIYVGLASRGRGRAVLLTWDGRYGGGLVPQRVIREQACAVPSIEDVEGRTDFRCAETDVAEPR